MQVANEIRRALEVALSALGATVRDIVLEHPAEIKNGDYSTSAALSYAKELGKNPRALAEEIVARLGTLEGVEKIEVAGPGFINFYLSRDALAHAIETASAEDMWGENAVRKGLKIMVEYTDPNPFKEFHIGHLMSNAIGESISRLLQFSGAKVQRANYQGDVGPHVAKAIWGKVHKPELSWGDAYVYGSAEYEAHKEEIDAVNKKVYEKSDAAVNELYDEGRAQSLAHFEGLYKVLGTKFDHYFFESETALRGVEIVKAHPDLFEESEGATVFKGEKYRPDLHTRVFVTSKGLPTYETKELGLAFLKREKSQFDISLTITANEQSDYFNVVTYVLKRIDPTLEILHRAHGMMRFAEGKMSSRTGNVITGESLLNELTEAAKERAKESRADDAGKLAEQVAVAAIKYQVLKQASHKDIIFDRERALSLEGDSGPYLQYTHARAHAVVEKAKEQNIAAKVDACMQPNELTRLLRRFPEVVERAAANYEPHFVTSYLLEIASRFNSWYAQEQILDGSTSSPHKVAITDAVRRTLKNGLWVLGIPTPEKM